MERYIEELFKLAKKSLKYSDIPVGAIVVQNNKIMGKGYNTREKDNNLLGHAEINAIKKAIKSNKSWKLNDCDIYVTLKPCNMCMEIIKHARINKIYYLLDKPDNKKDYYKTKAVKISKNDKENEYQKMLNLFFENLRNN